MGDIKTGDRVKCVISLGSVPDGYESRSANECSKIIEVLAPTVGTEWIVDRAEWHWRDEEQADMLYLRLCAQPSDYVYDARCFRKIDPVAPEAVKEECFA